MPERSEGGWVLQRSFNPPVQNPHKKIGAASAAPPSRSPRSSRPPRNLEKESIGACRFEANPENRSCLNPYYLTNDSNKKPRPKDRGNPIVTVTIHRRRDCGLNMQGRSCRIPEVADQCHVVWELCNSGISCLSTGVFVFDFFLRAMSFEEINWIHPSARFDRYCTFRFVKDFTRALSRCSDYIVQK